MGILKITAYIAYLAIFVATFSYLGNQSYIDHVMQEQVYEENVCLWQYDTAKSVSEDLRRGHPNYRYKKVKCNVYDKIHEEGVRRAERASARNTTKL